jgi:hypothetical protein
MQYSVFKHAWEQSNKVYFHKKAAHEDEFSQQLVAENECNRTNEDYNQLKKRLLQIYKLQLVLLKENPQPLQYMIISSPKLLCHQLPEHCVPGFYCRLENLDPVHEEMQTAIKLCIKCHKTLYFHM